MTQCMTPHITKNRHQESNLPVPHTEEDGGNEDTQMNGTLNENVPLQSITPSKSHTVVQQASCLQSNQDDCGQFPWQITLANHHGSC
jgi:hypothetical protein